MSGLSCPRVALICGGPSSEAAVSRLSVGRVQAALRHHYPDLHVLELTPAIGVELHRLAPDIAFPVLHGPPGEDGTIQGLLEIMQIPYVGSGVTASALAMDKLLTKQLLKAHGIPLACDLVVKREEGIDKAVQTTLAQLGHSVVIKPRSQGSSLGTSLVRQADELEIAFREAFSVESDVLVESMVPGKEATVSVLEHPKVMSLPVIEICLPEDARLTGYGYDEKYTPGRSEHIIPARLTDHQYQLCEAYAVKAFEVLGCRDFARADFMVPDDQDPVFLELNTIPGLTPTSLLPDAAEAAGLAFDDVLVALVERALARGSAIRQNS
ncbi:MAG: hypothetical protein B0D91_14550 [Oceanospirillales bacterium LUC14_002_19_P2]|nr:MAG: hypothetical protein B0D91_14550 [Oceanospirillales bacterium LUC14_002_19_P2]